MIYHDCKRLALVRDRDAASALPATVPDVFGHASRAIDTGWELVVGECTSAVLPAVFLGAPISVACPLANVQGATSEVTSIERHGGGDGAD